jgi:AP-3 complex subunit mu
VVTGVSDHSAGSGNGTLPNIPWRRAGVKHNPNEIYVDIIEEIDCVVDVVGNVVSFDVAGYIQIQSKLSGIPDLLLTFKDPSIIDDCSFHPCVRYTRFEKDSIVSFVPPDGNFQLMRYRVKPTAIHMGFSPPISVHPQIRYFLTDRNTLSGTIDVRISARSISSLFSMESRKGGVSIEDVSITIPFPKICKTTTLSANMGQVIYDEASKVAKWTIGKLDEKMNPQLTGNITVEGNKKPDENPSMNVTWKIPSASLSGISVGGLTVTGEVYKPYKGVRNIAKSGWFQIRCS